MKQYKLGLRFFKYRNLCCILVSAVVLCFYFIYRYLFSQTVPWWNDTLMAVIFVLVGVLFLWLIFFGADKIKQNVYYTLTDDALVSKTWSSTSKHPYKDFRKAYYGTITLSSELPIVFELEGGATLRLNQYIDELPELTKRLIDHITPYAEIDADVLAHVNALI